MSGFLLLWYSWLSLFFYFSCYQILLGFTGLYCVLLCFIVFYWVLLGFTVFFCVLLGSTGFYWVLMGFTVFYYVLLCSTGFSGLYWVRVLIGGSEWLLFIAVQTFGFAFD